MFKNKRITKYIKLDTKLNRQEKNKRNQGEEEYLLSLNTKPKKEEIE
ncbi:hypothetical protein IJJ97_00605 [bacterium]|nr:hypothetical protein [bacterium]